MKLFKKKQGTKFPFYKRVLMGLTGLAGALTILLLVAAILKGLWYIVFVL